MECSRQKGGARTLDSGEVERQQCHPFHPSDPLEYTHQSDAVYTARYCENGQSNNWPPTLGAKIGTPLGPQNRASSLRAFSYI